MSFDEKKIDETLRTYNKFYEKMENFKYDDSFDKLYIPSIDTYIKTLKMTINIDDKPKVDEYIKDNDDWLNGLSRKNKKLIDKQKRTRLMNEQIKNNTIK